MNGPAAATSSAGNRLAWLLALTVVWIWTWRYLAVEWRYNEQYNYGFAVPCLAIWIGWRRWRVEFAATGASRPATGNAAVWRLGFLATAWLALYLAELLRQQDPTWRLTGWLMMGAASMLTGLGLRRLGGRRLLRTVGFALAFTWLALPWPAVIENRITQGLMRLVTATVVDTLNWSGIAAVQHGNVIELSRGLVGVDTACSGVQSLQAGLMTSLFLGELYWLRWQRRLALVLAGWMLGLLGNLLRVFLLTRAVAAQGGSGVADYHDPVGYAITTATFLGIWLVATWLDRPQVRQTLAREGDRQPVTDAAAGPVRQSPVPTPAPPSVGSEPSTVRWWERRDGYALALALALLPLLAAAWFRVVPGRNTRSVQTAARWSLTKDRLAPGWRATDLPFAPAERSLLRFSQGDGLRLTSPVGWTARVLHVFWKPGAQVPSQAFSHTPDICMPSAGWEQLSPATPVTIRVRDWTLPCLLYRFRLGPRELAVLHAVWYGGEPEPLGDPSWSGTARTGRLAELWRGPFRRGHEVITLYLPALEPKEAQTRLGEEILDQVLAPGAKGATFR
ncbi:MAG: archaeosortase/exosortase family protein [Verrucomicrobia bacterium]|nr:archaeosortase/exosortase family protein [Verrucomicrobiota bacterium]